MKADSRTAVTSGLYAKAHAETKKARAQVMVSLLAAKFSPTRAVNYSLHRIKVLMTVD
jgi:hypothetical protein